MTKPLAIDSLKKGVALKNNRLQAGAGISALLGMLFLSSCSAGQANVCPQQPLFAASPDSSIAVACGPGNLVVGDLNSDGKPDVVVACGEERLLTVLLNTGGRDGHFRKSNSLPLPDPPGDMVLGDVNGDGNLDLAIDSHDSYGVVLLLGDGKGALALAPNSPIVMKEGQHPHTHGLAMADINGDRKLDLITSNNADNDVSIAFGDGSGRFTRASNSFAVGPSPYPFALADVNNDSFLDIIATATATGPSRAQQLPKSFALTLLLNDGRGGFRRSELALRSGQPWFADAGDLNGDRKPDLVATHHDQSALTVILGDGTGRFSEAGSSPFDWGRNAFQVALADVNRDGRVDALAASGEGVRIMLGDGRGNFRAAPGSPFPTGRGVWRLAVADMNGDSKLDIVTTNLESRSVAVLLGR
jgi:hypothetical protein